MPCPCITHRIICRCVCVCGSHNPPLICKWLIARSACIRIRACIKLPFNGTHTHTILVHSRYTHVCTTRHAHTCLRAHTLPYIYKSPAWSVCVCVYVCWAPCGGITFNIYAPTRRPRVRGSRANRCVESIIMCTACSDIYLLSVCECVSAHGTRHPRASGHSTRRRREGFNARG